MSSSTNSVTLVEATEKHSHLLQKFFLEQPINGHIDYAVYRPHGFFDQYKLLSDDHSTVLLQDKEQNLLGAASVTFTRAYINRQEQTVAFLSDLRVAHQRSAIQHWANSFIPHLYKKLEEKNCKYVFTTIEQYESQAYNALLRPQKLKRQLPRYYLFRKVNLVFYLARFPWAPKPTPSIRVSHGWDADMEEVCDYMMRKKIGSMIYFNTNPDNIKRKIATWPGFTMNNFLIARNHKNQIIGCMAPWNNRDVQQFIVRKYHGEGQMMYQTANLLSPLRLVQPLPEEDKAFNLKFITHTAVDNAEVFYALLNQAYNETTRGELLVHTNYFGDYHMRPPLSFMTTKIPFGFYSVFPPGEDLPAFLKPNPFAAPPDFNFVYI